MYKLYMGFDNPTEAFVGVKRSTQGMAIHGDTAIILYHTGVGAAYDLVSKNSAPVGVFKLGSFNDGVPDKRYINHANDCMFGPTLPGEDFPLLYVTAGNSGEADERGYIAYCAVEQIRLRDGVHSSETVQRIYYKNDGIEESGYQVPGWGWPASLVDVRGGWYYMFSSRYRTKKEFYAPDSAYRVTKFRLPDPSAGDVTLYPSDIVDQFDLPFNVFFTQGGTLRDGKIWYMFGLGRNGYDDALRVVDLEAKEYCLCEDLSGTEFGTDEVECCAFYGERLLINLQHGTIYERIEN